MAEALFKHFQPSRRGEHPLDSVTLTPGWSGTFEVRIDGKTRFSKKEMGRYPENKEVIEALAALSHA